MAYEPTYKQEEKKVEKKIVAKDYNYLRIEDDNNELEISSISNDEWKKDLRYFLLGLIVFKEIILLSWIMIVFWEFQAKSLKIIIKRYKATD